MSIIHIFAQPFEQPDSETRASLLNIMKRDSHMIACFAVVTPGGGFHVSAMRSRVTGMRFEAPGPFKLRFHSEVEEVIKWLPEEHEQRTGVPIGKLPLLKLLHHLADSITPPPRAANDQGF